MKGKEQITPCFFPTLMFDPNRMRKIDDICQSLLSHVTRTRLVNYVDILVDTNFEVKKHILTFVDSGGYRLKEYGAKIRSKKTVVIWHDKVIDVERVLSTQNENGDIGNTLDFPISSDIRNKTEYVNFNLNSARKSIEKKPDDLFLYGTIQAWDYKSAITYSKKISESQFDGFAIGGLVQFSHSPQKIIDIVAGVTSVIPRDKPVHVFGVTNPILMPILIGLGIDTFDSSSYIRSSLNRKYYLPLCVEKLTISEQTAFLKAPCSCPICRNRNLNIFSQNTIRSYAYLSLHNLHQIVNLIEYCKTMMVQGRLNMLIDGLIKRYGNKFNYNKIKRYYQTFT